MRHPLAGAIADRSALVMVEFFARVTDVRIRGRERGLELRSGGTGTCRLENATEHPCVRLGTFLQIVRRCSGSHDSR